MEYKLINDNFTNNYIASLISSYNSGVQASQLLNPDDDSLQPPTNLDHIAQGADLLNSVLAKNGKIVIIQDCDVDGITSSTILWLYILKLFPNADLSFKIHSGKQHGLEDMIESLEGNENIDLVILPDAGSNDEEYHIRLHDVGIPVLVLDHHEANEYSSNAVVINNQLSERYTNKALTGAGVVYQFCRYLDSYYGVDYADDFIDLAALGIISDMGSVLEPENAYIIKKGLNKDIKNYFFQTLLDKQSYSIGSSINSISIAFYITPLINALIRMGTMEEKEKLFCAFIDGHRIVPSTKRGEKGLNENLATQVARICTNARVHQNKALDGAIERIEFKIEDEGLNNNQLLIVQLDEEDVLPSTLNGLLAMKLAAKYKRPTLVLRQNSEGIARGSLRGINNSPFKDLRGYLEKTGLCEYAQGHANAAGCGIAASKIQKLINLSNFDLSEYDFGQTYYEVNFIRQAYDEDLTNLIIDIDKYRSIYGQGCPEPILAITNIDITKKDLQIMGSNKDTVKILKNGIAYMMFKAKNFIEEINNLPYNNIRLEVVGRANINNWMGNLTPQIFIDDYNTCDNTLLF